MALYCLPAIIGAAPTLMVFQLSLTALRNTREGTNVTRTNTHAAWARPQHGPGSSDGAISEAEFRELANRTSNGAQRISIVAQVRSSQAHRAGSPDSALGSPVLEKRPRLSNEDWKGV